MTTTFIVSAIAFGFVFIGNIIYDRKDKSPVNWKRALLLGGVSAALVIIIGLVTE
ncbi:MAG TPA: hypothetical protein PLZ45_15105 [Ferruginibacter sp.]|nr:hypothetical protein [Ferruginibacter sp.]